MTIRRKMLSLGAVGSMAVVLAACSQGADSPNNADGAPAGDVELLSWRLADPGPIGVLHNGWVDEFNASQDEIRVTGVPVPAADRGKKLINDVLAGNPADIVAITSFELPDFAEYLTPLDTYWENEGPEFEAAFTETGKELASWDGQFWGVATGNGSADGLYYNTEVLAAAGVDITEATSSWENFRAALEAIKASGATPMLLTANLGKDFDRLWGWYAAGGVDLSDVDALADNMCSDDGRETFTFLADLYLDGELIANPSAVGYDDMARQFAAGNVGFVTDGSWGEGIYEANSPGIAEKLEVTHMPLRDSAQTVPAGQASLVYVIPKGAKNPDAAWEFIKYMSDDQAQEDNATAGGFLPTRTAALESPTVQDNPLVASFAGLIDEADGGYVRPRGENVAEFSQIWITQFQAAVTGQAGVNDAFDAACSASMNL